MTYWTLRGHGDFFLLADLSCSLGISCFPGLVSRCNCRNLSQVIYCVYLNVIANCRGRPMVDFHGVQGITKKKIHKRNAPR